jgi:alcohol dehydrogenase (cytochrome c)
VVDDGFLYVPDGMAKVVKIDVRSGTEGRILWRFDPVTRHIYTTRGVALLDENVYSTDSGGILSAINRDSGEPVWQADLVAPPDPATGSPSPETQRFTAAPTALVTAAGRKLILQGESSGGSQGTRSHITATDAVTGEFVWRFFPVPGPGEFGHETWKNNAWITGGGGVWSTPMFDPQTNVAVWGTGDIFPSYDPEFRPGDNLFAASTIALDVDTGDLVWYFQATPNERWDLDSTNNAMLIPSADGTQRFLAKFERQGFHYTFDFDASVAKGPNAEGVFIRAVPYVDNITWTAGIDPKTGKPVEYDPNIDVQTYGQPLPRARMNDPVAGRHCPDWGGQNTAVFPSVFDPVRRLHYGVGNEACGANTLTEFRDGNEAANFIGQAGCCWSGAGADPTRMTLLAINIDSGERVMQHFLPRSTNTGLLGTAGDLIFAAHADGRVVAHDADTLGELWGFSTGMDIKAPAMTYSWEGRQYVAIVAGGNAGSEGGLPESGVLGGASLYVFGLRP